MQKRTEEKGQRNCTSFEERGDINKGRDTMNERLVSFLLLEKGVADLKGSSQTQVASFLLLDEGGADLKGWTYLTGIVSVISADGDMAGSESRLRSSNEGSKDVCLPCKELDIFKLQAMVYFRIRRWVGSGYGWVG